MIQIASLVLFGLTLVSASYNMEQNYAAASYAAPTYAAPISAAPTYAAPIYAAPAYTAPSHDDSYEDSYDDVVKYTANTLNLLL